jgi:hypothetical protein
MEGITAARGRLSIGSRGPSKEDLFGRLSLSNSRASSKEDLFGIVVDSGLKRNLSARAWSQSTSTISDDTNEDVKKNLFTIPQDKLVKDKKLSKVAENENPALVNNNHPSKQTLEAIETAVNDNHVTKKGKRGLRKRLRLRRPKNCVIS